MVKDLEHRYQYANPAALAMFGTSFDQLIGHTASELFDAATAASLVEADSLVFEGGVRVVREVTRTNPSTGETATYLNAKIPLRHADGSIYALCGVATDISERKSHQRHLEYLAHHDALTRLPNRILLADRLQVALARARRMNELLAVCLLDLDGFKPVNDFYGHEVGDQLLVEIAGRLTQILRADDTVARLGGDEFVLLLSGLKNIDECKRTLDRLLQAIAMPYTVQDIRMEVSASIGVAVYPLDDSDPDTLLRHADQAMYTAKEGGRNRYHLFDPEYAHRILIHRKEINRIAQGLANGEFRLHYQPKVNMHNGAVVGVEALIRWQHPERGLLSPAAFLSDIDNGELSIMTGEWVIETALAQMETWHRDGIALPVSVNISARHLQSPRFFDALSAALARHPHIPAGYLELEILETSALDDLPRVCSLIDACRKLGVSFALDDFGTGYSSLSYLKRLPVETLKIDQSFVRGMVHNSEDLAIVDGIIGLSDAFQCNVIAEGVEEVEHGTLLLHLGCDLAQGYGIVRPMPAEAVPAWITTWQTYADWKRTARIRHTRHDLPILIAKYEHRQWINDMASWISTDTSSGKPPLDSGTSSFDRWCHGIGQKSYGELDEFRAITDIHDQIHRLARELVDLKMAGHSEQALERLPELLTQYDHMVTYLEYLLERVTKDNEHID